MNSTVKLVFASLLLATAASGNALFINELHYDNLGPDTGEGVEIAALAGTSLDGFELQFYNGSSGALYRTVALSGVVSAQQGGFGSLFFAVDGLQNGAPDGVALVDTSGAVIQFLSYEGAFTAKTGAASGLASTDIGVFEDGTGAAGTSLQLIGSGTRYDDFSWVAGAGQSYGQINAAQHFSANVPLPATLPLLLLALGSGAMLRRNGYSHA